LLHKSAPVPMITIDQKIRCVFAVESQAKWHTEYQYGRNPVRVKTPLRATAL